MTVDNMEPNYFEETYFEKRVWISSARLSNALMMFTKPFVGEDDELGKSTIEGIIVALSECEMVPKVIVFWNNAVKLCVEGSKLLEPISRLERYGVRILVSGHSLDKLNLKSSLRVGKLANHFDLVEAINKVQKVTTF